MKKLNLLFSIFCCLFINFIIGQVLPPITNFSPNDYRAENQNWSITQEVDNGHIYFGNNSGLLEFNGAQWNLYPSPNQTIIRAVKAIGNRIYTGCYMEFGYWERNSAGKLNYTSLSDSMQQSLVEDEHFWKILNIGNYIIFQSLDRIYLFNTKDESYRVIDLGTPISKSFNVNETVYFQATGKGLFKIINGEAVVINEDSIVKDDILIDVIEIENSLVLITQNHGILEIKDDNLSSKPFSANDILNTKSIYSSLKLQDGQIAIGTVSNGFYLLDNMGKINMHLTQQEGLSNNTILSLFEDADGNIWLGLDNGVSVINLNSAFSVYKDTSGTLGTVYASAVFGGSIYLGTNQGLFYRKIGEQGKFMMIEGTSGQVWTLKTINGELFVGHNLGTFNVKNASVKWVSKVPGTWDIKPIPNKDNLLIQGNYDGLYILRKEDGNWKLENKLKGFEMSSRYFEFVNSNNILVSHEYKGIYNLTIDESFKNVTNSAPVEVPTGLKSSLIAFNNHIFYAYPGGMLVYSEDNEFTISSDIDEKMEQDSVYISGKLVNDVSNNRLWRFTENGLIYYSQRNLDGLLTRNFVPFPVSKRKEMQGFENILNLGEERYLLGSVDGFVIVNLEELGTESYAIELNSVKNSGNRNNSVLMNLSAETEFDASENSLEFSYNVASYNKFKGVDYQYRLLGIYDEWSAWSNEQTVNFENLPFGDYIFEVRARVGDQLTQNNERYSFKISRPWYLSFLAIASYIIGVILLLLLLNLRNNRHYRNKELRLKLENERKLELSQSKSEKEVMRLENEKLENNFKSKSRELAASAMSIVKKNELLTAIKKDLLPIKEVPQAKRVMRTIDKNLSDKEDWQFFEEAFTNADKDFFNTLKENHPKLTPKDMKLCAYLRLNLSSKEIAPLLNISTRSVEIKRYRLRKKLNLQHEKSLVEYIMMI